MVTRDKKWTSAQTSSKLKKNKKAGEISLDEMKQHSASGHNIVLHYFIVKLAPVFLYSSGIIFNILYQCAPRPLSKVLML